jgi:serine/threonine-protein kinase
MIHIGRYELEREIGRGAMGVVHLARDPRLDRRVALKTCTLPEGVSEEMAREFHARFLREARAAAGLSHPGIVTVFDSGEDETTGVPYIAMEFVAGHSLKEVLAGAGRCDRAWVMSTGALLADALHQAHQAGIVHRDIKPANILVRESDRAAKLADFGVARLKTSELTRTGAFLGSPGYMSPEQVKGGEVDGRSDLFSLAVVLYEALSGKRPFKGDDLVALAFSITNDTQPPLSRSIEHCPPGFDAFFERALAKDPEKRFPDGTEFREAFLQAGEGTAATMPAAAMSAAARPSATMPLAGMPSARTPSTAAV